MSLVEVVTEEGCFCVFFTQQAFTSAVIFIRFIALLSVSWHVCCWVCFLFIIVTIPSVIIILRGVVILIVLVVVVDVINVRVVLTVSVLVSIRITVVIPPV